MLMGGVRGVTARNVLSSSKQRVTAYVQLDCCCNFSA